MNPTVLSRDDLAALSAEARKRPRLRANRNLHAMEDPVHRLLNAIEPGSYVRPHRHLSPPKTETLVVVAGALGLVLFDDAGRVASAERLEAGGPRFLVDLPPDAWHSFVALAPGTVFFETKPGPYLAPVEGDLGGWAPAEGGVGADAYLRLMAALFAR